MFQRFTEQVVRLRPRCDADSRPLILLFAGVVSFLTSQISNHDHRTRMEAARQQVHLDQEVCVMQVRVRLGKK